MTFEMITISIKKYEALLEDSKKLSFLEMFGVDNWSGYEDAMREMREEEEDEEGEEE
uniref:Uncharacterized protein n=1 Tax=viral metagenome TaxID=1070528 RepID=A0A6H1ZQ79_9ZZZZ